ncbi:MAG: S53 family peptidase [Sinobacteraceae bacterium]|nr:S53 family peptidase [Nevskiaceae bacterium]
MKGWRGLGQAGVLALALALTTSGFAEERALTVEGQRFLMRGMEQAWASGRGHLAMSHGRVCSVATQPGVASCHAHIVHDETGRPFATPGPAGYAPADLRNAYSVTGTGGGGTVIAIVDAYGYPNAESDLATYRAQFGLPACTTANGCFRKVNQEGVQGNYPPTSTGWSQETALDLDMVSAMCPGCSILLVEANDASLPNLAASVSTAATMGAHAISNSYGGGEAGTQSTEQFYNYAGIAVTASSGDGGFGVEFPASSPHVTAVGGTTLTRSGFATRGFTETAWSGAGSGCSAIYPKPTWQSDGGCPRRTVADVSAVADPNTGVAVFAPAGSGRRNRSAWLVFGGTSVAAPLIAGLYGVNDTAVNFGSDPYRHTADLNDVTSGSNGTCAITYLCTAVPGYDGPTGLGTPKGAAAFGF